MEQKKQIRIFQSAHLEVNRNIRRVAAGLKVVSEKFPSDFCFEMADRMNSAKTALPLVPRLSKSMSKQFRLGHYIQNILTNHKNFYLVSDET